MNAVPRVSVMIPTYNRAALLCDAIDSVFAQSFQDFEIIVVDDGSTDNTREVLVKYGTRVQYLYSDHAGPARARNLGFEAARGEYLCILDSDDLYYPHKLALQVDHLDTHPDTVMVYTDFSAFDAAGFWDEFHLPRYHKSAYGAGKRSYDQLFAERWPLAGNAVLSAAEGASRAPHWLQRCGYRGELFDAYLFDTIVFTNSMMFRRSLLASVGLQSTYFGHFHDLEFALRICKAGKVTFIDNPTYKLRYHVGQVSTTAGADGGLNAVKLQRGLLRVARVHGWRDRAYYAANRGRVDMLIARLCRAAAVPLIAYGGSGGHRRKYFPRRARRYLDWSARHGHKFTMLRLISYLPTLAKRVYFRLQAISGQRSRAGAAQFA